ncbi:MAG: septation protein SpoVG family protein [Rubripirellula sp.]
MDITEIRIKLMEDPEDRLKAFCSITIDDSFVVRDLKIIEGINGLFVAMPSRKMTVNCHRCRHKNQMRAAYCNQCGAKQRSTRNTSQETGSRLYADIAHPINSECREQVQNSVLDEYEKERQRFQQPGYRSRYDDDFACEESSKVDIQETTVDKASQGPPKPHLASEHTQEHATEPKVEQTARPGGMPPAEQRGFGEGIF